MDQTGVKSRARSVIRGLLALVLAIGLMPALPATAWADDGETGGISSGITTAEELQKALDAAAQSENKTVVLTGGITITDEALAQAGGAENPTNYGAAVINVPAGVTLDGDGHSIIADSWTSTGKYHMIGVNGAGSGTETTIKNLTIVGNENTKSGVHAYACQGTVVLDSVEIQGCGNAGVQVNGSTVKATSLTTSDNAWGAVNVDQGSAVGTTASFELESGNLSEPLKIWTELKTQEDVVTVPDGWAEVKGANVNDYAPVETLTSNVVYNKTAKTYYRSLELAVKEANTNDVLDVYPGNYNIQQDDTTEVSGQTGWYLPINKSLTIRGVDANGNEITNASQTAANIYSTDYSANGSWATQNLITVFADNVTISGVTIMNKITANKAVEVTSGAGNFVIKNCAFAPIAEELLKGLDPDNLGGYEYEEYKEYGASLYFNGNVNNAKVEGNYFDHSGITFDGTSEASIEVSGNVFEGVKNWSNDPSYTYSTIGYTSWSDPPVTNISQAKLTIEKNQFINAGNINFSKVDTGSVDVSGNYWEGMDLTSALTGKVEIETVYADKGVTTTVSVSSDEDTLQQKIEEAAAGATIDLGGQYWPGNLVIDKNITLKNGYVDTITAIGDFDGLTLESLTFRNVSTEKNGDVNPSALYLQGSSEIKNVTVLGCMFDGPESNDVTIAITTLNVDGLTVEGCTIDGYTISAYHNPGTGGSITYNDNTILNVLSGIAFIGTDGVKVTGNTFENANGVRIEPGWDSNGPTCADVVISENKFLSVSSDDTYGQYAVRVQNSDKEPGVSSADDISLEKNYWGSATPTLSELIVGPAGLNVVPTSYYVDENMTRLNTEPVTPPSGGGGTAPSAPSYDLTVAPSENGSVELSDDSAEEGDEVTVTVKPDAGFELDELTVTDEDGEEVELAENADGTYSFTMPAGDVTVTATFACDGGELCPSHGFSDVDCAQWYHGAIDWAVAQGVLHGIGGTDRMEPDGEITRAQMAQVLSNVEGAETGDASLLVGYADADASAWYAGALSWAVEQGIFSGWSEGGASWIDPEGVLTREQAAAVLMRWTESNGGDVSGRADLSGYPDPESVSDWAVESMQWAVSAGVLSGVAQEDGALLLAGQGTATRAQTAQLMMRLLSE